MQIFALWLLHAAEVASFGVKEAEKLIAGLRACLTNHDNQWLLT